MDWNNISFSLPGGSAFASVSETSDVDQGSNEGRATMAAAATSLNGTAERLAYQAGQDSMSQPEWRKIALVAILDAITIGCIFWLLFFSR
jgi:hypothetical protein